jgi:5-methylcytosine-specific restriction endonuclease McrA
LKNSINSTKIKSSSKLNLIIYKGFILMETEKNSYLSEKQYNQIKYLLSLSGTQKDQTVSLLTQFLENLVKQQYVFNDVTWRVENGKDSEIFNFLNSLYGERKNWDKEKIFNKPAIKFVRELNTSLHNEELTPGGAKFFKRVASLQEGEYCVICGSQENLEVDHINAVNMRGHPEDINNMQLLCIDCNRAKTNYSDQLLPFVIVTQKSRNISGKLRYKFFYDNLVNFDGRNMGCCQYCGENAKMTKLHVVLRNPKAAANYSNLSIMCDNCRKKEGK